MPKSPPLPRRLWQVDSQEERVLEQAKLEERRACTRRSDRRSEGLERRARKNDRAFEYRAGDYGKARRIECGGRKAATARGATAGGRQGALQGTRPVSWIALEPFVDNSVFDLVMRGEDVTAKSASAITGLVEGGVSKIDQLLTINAEANLAAGLLAEAAHVGDPVLIQPIRERFLAATATIDRNLRQLPGGPETTVLQERAEALLAFGAGPNNIFDVRERTLRAASGDRHSLEADEKQLAALKTAHESLLVTLTPMIDDAAFDLVLTTEKVYRRQQEGDHGAYRCRRQCIGASAHGARGG